MDITYTTASGDKTVTVSTAEGGASEAISRARFWLETNETIYGLSADGYEFNTTGSGAGAGMINAEDVPTAALDALTSAA